MSNTEVIISCDAPVDATLFADEYIKILTPAPYKEGEVDYHAFNNCVVMDLTSKQYDRFIKLSALDFRIAKAAQYGNYYTFKPSNGNNFTLAYIAKAYDAGFEAGRAYGYIYYH